MPSLAHHERALDTFSLLVIDDQRVFHAAIDLMCQADGGIEIVGAATSVAEGIAALACDPDLVLIDVNMAGVDGMTGARMILADRPELPIVVCSTARLGELPALPQHPGVMFVSKEDLDADVLRGWYRARRPGHG
jgi:CheY-like chemotaxis protein